MKAVAADATRVPVAARLLLALGVLLSVAAFPTRFRVVVLKRQHPQPRGSKQSDEPENGGNDAPTLVPHGTANGEENINDELEEDRREVEQQTELKKLDTGAKHVPDILKAKGVVDSKVPSRGIVVVVPSSLSVDQSQVSFSLVVRTSSGVRPSIVSSSPTAALRAPLESLSVN
jgi:hypothetical protein